MTRLVWTDEQIKWLADQIAKVEGYARMTTLPESKDRLHREAQILKQVQHAVRTETTRLPPRLMVWYWWAYWFSACWIATKFSMADEFRQQFEDSTDFRQQILRDRESQLQLLNNTRN